MFYIVAATQELPSVLQISTTQTVLALIGVFITVGVAWGTLKHSVKTIESSVRNIERNIDKLRDSLAEHKADITGLKTHTKYGVIGSPMLPSDEGKRVLNESRFHEQYAAGLREKIFTILNAKQPRTLYDYEVSAYEALDQLRDDPLIDPLKDYAVNHPNESLELIFRIASWVVRDDYAETKGTPTQHDT